MVLDNQNCFVGTGRLGPHPTVVYGLGGRNPNLRLVLDSKQEMVRAREEVEPTSLYPGFACLSARNNGRERVAVAAYGIGVNDAMAFFPNGQGIHNLVNTQSSWMVAGCTDSGIHILGSCEVDPDNKRYNLWIKTVEVGAMRVSVLPSNGNQGTIYHFGEEADLATVAETLFHKRFPTQGTGIGVAACMLTPEGPQVEIYHRTG